MHIPKAYVGLVKNIERDHENPLPIEGQEILLFYTIQDKDSVEKIAGASSTIFMFKSTHWPVRMQF